MLPIASSADSFWTIIVHERVLWRDNKNQMIEDTAPHATDVLLEPIVVMWRHRLGSRDFNSQFDETDHRPHQSLLLSLENTIQHKKHANRCVRQVRHQEIARGALDYQMARNRWLPLMQKIDIVRLKAYKAASPKLRSSRKSTTTRSVIDASTLTIVLSSPLQIHDQSPCSYKQETPSKATPYSSSTSSIALPAILACITIPSTTRPANPPSSTQPDLPISPSKTPIVAH